VDGAVDGPACRLRRWSRLALHGAIFLDTVRNMHVDPNRRKYRLDTANIWLHLCCPIEL
jgi:hypothetical protein